MSYQKKFIQQKYDLSKKAVLAKVLKKDLINGYTILKGARYFSLGTFQIYLINFSYNNHFRSI